MESIIKIIDYQFMTAVKFARFQFALFIIGFIIPFMLAVFREDSTNRTYF